MAVAGVIIFLIMNIIFMGTPKPAADILKKLIKHKINITAVVAQPDRQKGRGLKMAPCETAVVAAENGLRLFKPETVKDPVFLKNISELKPDLAVIVAYGKILPKRFLDIPKFGCINVHASLLPKYRGASPIQAALLNGDKETGVTIFELNERMDEGDIIAQEKVLVSDQDNAWTLSEKLFDAGGELLLRVIDQLEGASFDSLALAQDKRVKGRKQDNDQASYCKIIKKEDGKIDFGRPAREIVNMVRAFTPWPGAFTKYNGRTLKIVKAAEIGDVMETVLEKRSAGQVCRVIKDEGFEVVTGRGTILVKEVKPENSKEMSAGAFISGYHLKIGDKFE